MLVLYKCILNTTIASNIIRQWWCEYLKDMAILWQLVVDLKLVAIVRQGIISLDSGLWVLANKPIAMGKIAAYTES